MQIKKHIPNTITLLNVVSGFYAIMFAYQANYRLAFLFIFLASFFDFLDGGAARLLKVQSEIGKQLDSLCDVVSFGVAPGMVMFSMMRQALGVELPLQISSIPTAHLLLLMSMALVPAFSALRLAKFNVDTRQTSSFIGLPVPANALLISSIAVASLQVSSEWLQTVLCHPVFWLLLAIFQSYMLVSNLPMFALKFKSLSLKENYLQFSFLIVALFCVIFFCIKGVALSIIIYILLSIIVRLLKR